MKWIKSKKQRNLEERFYEEDVQEKTIFTWWPTLVGDYWYWLTYVDVESWVYYGGTRRIKFFEVYEEV